MRKKYLHKTVKKGIAPKDITLLLTKCFGEEFNSPHHDCFHCQVRNRCRYIFNKGLKKKLIKQYKEQIDKKLKKEEESEKRNIQKEVKSEKKNLLKELSLAEKLLKKKMKVSDKKSFKAGKGEIKKEIKSLEKAKKILKKFFKE